MTATLTWSDTTFPCMGTTARVLVLGGSDDLAALARVRLAWLEVRWSRFEESSELCRLNAAGGRPVVVSEETFTVVALAVAAWHATEGRFDPTVIDALEVAGYDRDFALVAAGAGGASPAPPRPAPPAPVAGPSPGAAGIELDPVVRSVCLPPGVRLDLGGIGKGHAADLTVAELIAAGAEGACVDLGGDVALAGTAPEPVGWRVGLDDTLGPGRPFRLGAGGVATSTRLRRAWMHDGVPEHHLVDPSSGEPAWTGLAAVTVLAGTAAWAEVLAKAAFVAGPVDGAALLAMHHVTGRFLHDDGRVEELPGLEPFLA
jgi:thiamine biosynthesis lipoprotein